MIFGAMMFLAGSAFTEALEDGIKGRSGNMVVGLIFTAIFLSLAVWVYGVQS